jgi:hypothetical protein
MKRALICLLTLLAVAMPRLARAQYGYNDDNGPPPYNDVEDGQTLRIAGYILAPFGYALEWGLTRPLHHAATDTPLAPVLSGDTEVRYFGQTSNADRLPPGTFAPFQVPANPNTIDFSSSPPLPPYYHVPNVLPPVSSSQVYQAPPYSPGGQSAMH